MGTHAALERWAMVVDDFGTRGTRVQIGARTVLNKMFEYSLKFFPDGVVFPKTAVLADNRPSGFVSEEERIHANTGH